MLESTCLHLAGLALSLRYAAIWAEMERLGPWLEKDRRRLEQDLGRGAPRLCVVIPALEEYSTLPQAVASLKVPDSVAVDLVVVTSEKERVQRERWSARAEEYLRSGQAPEEFFSGLDSAACRRLGGLREPAEVRRVLAESPWTWDLELAEVEWLHLPESDSRMADQLNLAIDTLAQRYASSLQSTYLVVFNADSVAAPDSLLRLAQLLVTEELPVAAQLMCVPMLNFARLTNPYLRGAAIYQSRWALGYEFAMLGAGLGAPSLQRAYRYCRGHGMTFRLDFLVRYHFETSTALEDLFQGFLVSALGQKCPPVPVLEWTESPESTADLLRQKSNWFDGMLDLPRYPELLRRRGVEVSAPRLLLMLGVGFYREVFAWLCGPLCTLLFVLAALFTGHPTWALLPVINAVISTLLVCRYTPSEWLPRGHFLSTVVGVLAYSLSRNLGPLKACWRRCR